MSSSYVESDNDLEPVFAARGGGSPFELHHAATPASDQHADDAAAELTAPTQDLADVPGPLLPAPNCDGPCMAAAIAVCTLNTNANFTEVAEWVHAFKYYLGLSAAGVVAILTVGQPLFMAWQDWKLALTIAVSFAIKSTHDEAFHVGDVPFARGRYHFFLLRDLERAVLAEGEVHLHSMESRLNRFRSALTEVLLSEAHLLQFVAQPRRTGRVLVVEDDPFVMHVHIELLRTINPNFRIAVATNATVALEQATQAAVDGYPFDLILLDLVLHQGSVASPDVLRPGMPNSSGFRFADEFRDAEADVSSLRDCDAGCAFVVLVTGNVMVDAHRMACKLHGIDLVVPKPLRLDRLNAIVSFCWGSRY